MKPNLRRFTIALVLVLSFTVSIVGSVAAQNAEACPLNDPRVGNNPVVVDAYARVPHGTTVLITGTTPLYWQPVQFSYGAISIPAGKEFHVSGVDATGQWVRLTIGCEAGWVPRSATSLPPVVFRSSFD